MKREDRNILRALAAQTAEIAALPEQELRKREWLELNMKRLGHPLVMLGDIPWWELNGDGELTLLCEDAMARGIEEFLRQTLYRWKHMRGDMVVWPYFAYRLPVDNLSYGLQRRSKEIYNEEGSGIASLSFEDLLGNEDNIERIRAGRVSLNRERYERERNILEELFSDLLPVREIGAELYFTAWDEISTWHGVDNCLYDMIDRPEFLHRIMRKFTDMMLDYVEQFNALGLFAQHQDDMMFTPANLDWEQQPAGPEGSSRNSWTLGRAQIMVSVSREMHEEFEIPYAAEFFRNFGNVYYGCCEPLHDRIDLVRRIPNVRKISISPWADVRVAAENIGADYVMSQKPNPAALAGDAVDWDSVVRELAQTRDICRESGTPVQIVMKDISTVRHDPGRLWRWTEEAVRISRE